MGGLQEQIARTKGLLLTVNIHKLSLGFLQQPGIINLDYRISPGTVNSRLDPNFSHKSFML